MRKTLFFICLLSSVLRPLVRASEPIDLGQGLTYLRINSLTRSAADLNAALLRSAALVLDLRYTADEPAAADILRVLSSQPAKPTLYVLVSPATPKAIAEIVATASARLVTLGVKDSRPVAQVVVSQTAEADRAAYAAFESGTGLAPLITGKIEKERFDEASLVQEFKNGHHDAQPALPGPESGGGGKVEAPVPPGTTGTPPAPPTPPIDRVLQRTVHLHRALLALKRG